MTSPSDALARLVREGILDPDPAQTVAAKALSALATEVERYDPAPRGLLRRRVPKAPRGLYLWGGVGAGKSLLMDLFHEAVRVERKERIHFHAFMQRTHRFVTAWRRMDDDARRAHPARAERASLDDPIPHAAKDIFLRARLLCFDEVQVSDITDATLLGRLFAELYSRGTVMVATSNRHPDDLYKDGINRELFVPAIQQMKAHLDIHELAAAKDYRLDRLEGRRVYVSPLGTAATAFMDQSFSRLTAGAVPKADELDVGRRRLVVPQAARDVARGPFAHWCGQGFGPGDYLSIASTYPVVMIDDIPPLGPENRNEAKRFVTFIDALYEARTMLLCSAAAEPDRLYPSGDGSFEFQRTASRLFEMRSEEYLCAAHRECPRQEEAA